MRVPSAGWRAVYRWCEVPLPDDSDCNGPQSGEGLRAGRQAMTTEKSTPEREKGVPAPRLDEQTVQRLENIRLAVANAHGCEELGELVDQLDTIEKELREVRKEIEA